ncbi:MAG TPA: oligosaccharide flippase family protein [Acidimicrobiales bacterium]|nr:oligosaccharide flippase family protein [Acidimicrobiales bacterium]
MKPSPGEGQRVVGAIGWSSVGTIANFAALSIALPITARLIEPAVFGAVAFAMSIVATVTSVTITIITQAVIEPDEIDQRHMRATLTASLCLGLPLAAAVFAAGPLTEDLLHFDGSSTALRYVSAIVLIRSVGRVPRSGLYRQLRFRTLTASQTVSYFVGGLIVPVAMATAGYGVEALALGYLVQELIDLVWCWRSAHWLRPAGLGSIGAAGQVLRANSAMSAIGLTSVLSQQIDNFAIGAVLGADGLGQYSRVYRLSTLPANLFTDAVGVVLFPAVARVRDQRDRLLRSMTGGFLAAAAGALPLCLVAAVYSHEIVRLVLGPGWEQAASAMQFLAPAAAARVLLKVAAAVHRGVALKQRLAWLSATYTTTIGLGALIGAQFGLAEAALGVLIGVTVGAVLCWLSLGSAVPGLLRPLSYVTMVLVPTSVGVVGFAVASRSAFGGGLLAMAISLLLGYALTIGVVAAGAERGWPPAAWVSAQVRNVVNRRSTPASPSPHR